MAFLYPWGNTQQLNLDWILQKIKELEAGGGGADIDEVAETLLAASYRQQAYNQFDIVFRDGKLYLANADIAAPGEAWTPAHWDEIVLGGPVSALMQHVSNLDSDNIINDSQVTGDTVSDALDTLKDAIDNIPLDSDNVSNASQVTGDNVSDALDNLSGAIGDETTARTNADNAIKDMIAYVETGPTATRTYYANRYLIWNNKLYRTIQQINAGATFTVNTNIVEDTIGNAIGETTLVNGSYNTAYCNGGNVYAYKIGRFLFLSGWIRISTAPTGVNDIVATGLPMSGFKQYVIGYDETAKDIVCLIYDNNDTNIKAGYGDYTTRVGHIIDFTGVYLITNN